jgi:hypothetical protein
MSPASGVRSAPGPFRPPALPQVPAFRDLLDSDYVEPDTGTTEVGTPDPALLLALAKGQGGLEPAPEALEPEGEPSPAPQSARWHSPLALFVFGMIVGGALVWAATNDVTAQVFRARLWAASTLRSVRAHAHGADDLPAASAAPVVGGATASPAAPGALNSPAPAIPTVDVTQLPKAREERVQPPGTPPVSLPPAPGAPALQHAPGPR